MPMLSLVAMSVQALGQIDRTPGGAGEVRLASSNYAIGTANPFIQEMVDAVSRDSLASYISALQAFGTRYEYTPQRDAAAEYILRTFNSFGIAAQSDWYAWGTATIRDLEMVSHDSIWAVGGRSMIVATTDAGQTWKTQIAPTSATFYGVDFANRLMGWAVGSNGSILHTTDAGEVWFQQASGVTARLQDVDFVNERLGIAVGSEGVVLRTSNGGTDWTLVDCGTKAGLLALKMLDSLHVWAVGDSGKIVHSTDGGIRWITQPSGVSASYNLRDVDFINSEIGWAVGDVTRKTTDGGKSWMKIPSPAVSWYCISFQDSLSGYGGSNLGDVFRTTDGGQSWLTLTNVRYTLVAIKAASSGEILSCGILGLIASRNGGATWTNLTPNLPSEYIQKSRNIVATITGQISPEKECIIIAHYDSYSDQYDSAPGANDNASGTSAVMEAARLCCKYGFSFTVKFFAVSAEELGLLGSRDYAWRARNQGTQILGVINGDMIGYPVTGDTVRLVIGSYGKRNRLIDSALANNLRYNIGLSLTTFANTSGGSDYVPFAQAGYDALDVAEATATEIWGGADPYYHKPTDTIDKLNLGLVRRGAQLMLATVAELAVPLERVTSVSRSVPMAEHYVLYQNYPNPFNPSTTISYSLPNRSHMSLTVFNTLGQQVAVLHTGEQEAGYHEVKFNGSGHSSGVYFYRIQVRPLDSAIGRDSKGGAGEFVQTLKILLVR
jgi:photosystem II stability/assembly factor-like uncharacterized protein